MFSVANGLDAHEMAPNRLHPHCYASSNNLARRAEMAAHSLGMILAIFTGIIMQSSAGKITGFVSTKFDGSGWDVAQCFGQVLFAVPYGCLQLSVHRHNLCPQRMDANFLAPEYWKDCRTYLPFQTSVDGREIR